MKYSKSAGPVFLKGDERRKSIHSFQASVMYQKEPDCKNTARYP